MSAQLGAVEGAWVRFRPHGLWGLVCLAPFLWACSEVDAPSEGDLSFDDRPVGTLQDAASFPDRSDLNVLFILVDTLRADRLGSYGYERATSPVLDYIAGTGLRFARHRAQSSWTKASMASLWTGFYPQRADVLTHRDAVHEEARMPAEVFTDNGFYSAGIWRNGWVAPNFGFRQGFDIYMAPRPKQAPSAMRRKPIAGRIDGTDIDAVFSAKEFLRTNQERRFFLYVHLMDVHQYISTEETAIFGTSLSDGYDNSILWEDQQIGEIVAELYRLDMADRTLIVVASDHGEAFGEHGLEGHARDVHNEVTHTPFIIGFPFRLDPGLVIELPTENVDIFPTLYELLGLEDAPEMDGKSRANWILGDYTPDFPARDYAHLDRTWGRTGQDPDPIVAVTEGTRRLIHDVNNPDFDRLYDVKSDPREMRNIAADEPDVLKRLRSAAEDYLALPPAWEGGAPEIELDEMSLRQLRALGYSIEE
ncbi:MAG: sulfatase-like hydrolase/transferase [bacterium]|nr:sulfatase-like hydrolase/transferase [bacterium]